MSRDLREQFSDLADDMTGTDLTALRHLVDRTSRRLRARRIAATSAVVAVAVLAVLTGGATLLRLRADDPLPAVPPPSVAVPPSASPTAVKSTVDGGPGTLSFLTMKAGKPIELRRYVDGTLKKTVGFGTATGNDIYAAPSPDGTLLAINTSPDMNSIAPGDLVIVASGGARRTIAREVRWGGGSTVVWTPDGTAVIAGGTRYDVTTGASQAVEDAPQYLAYSPNAVTRAYVSPTEPNAITIVRSDGSVRQTIPVTGLRECEETAGCPTSVQAISDSGLYVALGNVNSDPSHVDHTQLVYHTVKHVRIELGPIEHVWFRTDGAVALNVNQVTVYDPAWKVLRTYRVPAHDSGAAAFYQP